MPPKTKRTNNVANERERTLMGSMIVSESLEYIVLIILAYKSTYLHPLFLGKYYFKAILPLFFYFMFMIWVENSEPMVDYAQWRILNKIS
jgi:hypothetical protein